MNQQEIDKFVESEVIEINGKLFIAKEKVTDMIIEFANQQVEKRCAVLVAEKDIAVKTCDRLAEEKIMLSADIKHLTESDGLRKSAIDNCWEPALKQQKLEIEELKAKIKRHQEVFEQVEIFLEVENFNEEFYGIEYDDADKILADVKELKG